MKNDAKLDSQDEKGNTPLHLACENGHLNMVKFLLNQGALDNAETRQGLTPLQVAAHNNHSELVWWLVRTRPALVV